MDPNSPFAKNVPIIGQPQILNMTAIVLMQCNCDTKPLLMGPVGPMPLVCGSCRKAWQIDAQVQIGVTAVVLPEPEQKLPTLVQ